MCAAIGNRSASLGMDADKGDLAATRAERERLAAELERLEQELAQTTAEKVQSAQLGLVLLDDKEELQRRVDELEAAADVARRELHDLREVSDGRRRRSEANGDVAGAVAVADHRQSLHHFRHRTRYECFRFFRRHRTHEKFL